MGKHYVPQNYLKGFSIDQTVKEPRIYVCEKQAKCCKVASVKSVAQSQNYWDDQTELFLSKNIESPANSVLRKIRDKGKILAEEKKIFAVYISSILQRVPAWKKFIATLDPSMDDDLLREFNAEIDAEIVKRPDKVERLELIRSTMNQKWVAEKQIRDRQVFGQLLQSPRLTDGFGQLVAGMNWRFLVSSDDEFVVSDNPIYFPRDFGLMNIHSELTMPISKHVALIASWTKGLDRVYFAANNYEVNQVNRKTVLFARFIFCSSEIPTWDHYC